MEITEKYTESLFSSDYSFSIKKIKFKPGYMNLWRNAREVVKTSLNLKFQYQHKLTKYLLKYNKFLKFHTFLIIELQLFNILLKTKIFPDSNSIETFIDNGLIFINNLICKNKYTPLFIGDFIQLIINIKYYILYKWYLNWTIQKKIRLKIKSKKKLNPASLPDDKQKSYTLPNWILTNKDYNNDIPKYLEVDYQTLSVMIIYEPLLWEEINPYNFLETKFGIINLYNWKYIT